MEIFFTKAVIIIGSALACILILAALLILGLFLLPMLPIFLIAGVLSAILPAKARSLPLETSLN